ncbi:RDD family protein [Pseudaeromonas sp. ZJS20]|uniref:RDD family protein n=1 Tax=Pseudaeromonas aegiceratis TaxID=3153928 RepID=UPI00390C5E8C
MFCSSCGQSLNDTANFCPACGEARAVLAEAAPIVSLVEPALAPALEPAPASAPVAVEPRYAGFWWRVLASLIDGILSQIVSFLVALPMGFILGVAMAAVADSDAIEAVGGLLGALVGMLVQWLWYTLPESSSWQGSLGKKLLGIKVTDEQGQRIGFGRANARYWGKIVSTLTLGIGFLMVAFTRRKQGLHDIIAGTLLVRA